MERDSGATQNERIERAILGVLLEQPTLAPDLDVLRPEDFAFSSHQEIFRQMQTMVESGGIIDVTLLATRLEAKGKLESVGGFEYLAGLVDGVVHRGFPDYVRTLKEHTCRRQAAHALERAAKRAANPSISNEEFFSDMEKLSAVYRNGVVAETKIRFRTATELAAETPDEVGWIARPWVAAGAITLAIGKVKAAGKTTFFTYLVRSVLSGMPFMSAGTTKGSVVYLTEQSASTFKVALKRAGLLEQEDLRIMTWGEASRLPWSEVMRLALAECKRIGAVLLVVDTLGQFTGLVGDAENNAGDALRAMQPLQQAAADGLGVLASQHERKSGGEVEDSGRGSTAFSGASDIVLNIRRHPGQGSPNVRVIRALSRYDEPLAEVTVELTPDGYVVQDARQVQTSILAAAPASESLAMELDRLCETAEVKRTTGQAAVENLVAENRLLRVGKGVKGSPYRYYKQPEDSFCQNSTL